MVKYILLPQTNLSTSTLDPSPVGSSFILLIVSIPNCSVIQASYHPNSHRPALLFLSRLEFESPASCSFLSLSLSFIDSPLNCLLLHSPCTSFLSQAFAQAVPLVKNAFLQFPLSSQLLPLCTLVRGITSPGKPPRDRARAPIHPPVSFVQCPSVLRVRTDVCGCLIMFFPNSTQAGLGFCLFN